MQYTRIGSLWLLLLAAAGATHAQQPAGGPGIYTCTDARGRTITADRPIADCVDREQRELSPSGSVRRKLEPTYTAREQAEREDRERVEALVQIDAVTNAARKRLSELAEERRKIDDELEFYAKDVSKAPDSLRRKFDDNSKSMTVQNRFIADQDDEKKRVNARFDEERARLRPLWAGNAPATSTR